MLLHLGSQIGDHPIPLIHQNAVQPHAIVEQVGGIVVVPHFETAVAHHHTVDDIQLPKCLPEMSN